MCCLLDEPNLISMIRDAHTGSRKEAVVALSLSTLAIVAAGPTRKWWDLAHALLGVCRHTPFHVCVRTEKTSLRRNRRTSSSFNTYSR